MWVMAPQIYAGQVCPYARNVFSWAGMLERWVDNEVKVGDLHIPVLLPHIGHPSLVGLHEVKGLTTDLDTRECCSGSIVQSILKISKDYKW
jgi:hypothetical protein